MAKSANQKLKLLYLMRYLLQSSDEAHPVSIQQMTDALAAHDVKAERKSLYDDLEALRLFGLVGQKGYAIIPLSLYFSGKWVKVELGLCKGKKLYDKRETMAKKDAEREIERAAREKF